MEPGRTGGAGGGRVIGVDLGADAIHAVALSRDLTGGKRTVLAADLFGVDDLEALAAFCASPHIAIDAPERPSEAPHLGDGRMSAKFQTARCGEGALGRRLGIWVPWTTPPGHEACPGWMTTGFAVWDRLRATAEPIEVFPHAVFLRLAGRRLPNKQTVGGRRARLDLLGRFIGLPPFSAAWSHDMVDALAAALVAWHHWHGTGEPITCDPADPWPLHDGSAIWMPPAP
jgi:hypothetical protein